MNGLHGSGPVVFAYDGSDLAKQAIQEAGRLLEADREALVVTVWQPFDVGFLPVGGMQFDAAQIADVRAAAAQTAAAGAALAEAAGFRAQSAEVEHSPIWKGIAQLADEHDARLIVLGSHGRSSLAGVLVGSVTSAVAAHSRRTVRSCTADHERGVRPRRLRKSLAGVESRYVRDLARRGRSGSHAPPGVAGRSGGATIGRGARRAAPEPRKSGRPVREAP